MRDLAKNPGGTMWAPTAGGVMKDPDLTKAASITPERILQEACQQVLQNFNSLLDTLIPLDERQCIGTLVLSRFAGIWQKCGAQNWDKTWYWQNSVNSHTFLKVSVDSRMIPYTQRTQQWLASGNQENNLICSKFSVKAVKGSAGIFVLNSLEPLCNPSAIGGQTQRFVALPLSDFLTS